MAVNVVSDMARCEHLLADHLAAAVQRFGAGALAVIDLPELDDAARVGAPELRAVATLLWARHVEASGLIELVDALGRGITDGSLHVLIDGEAVEPLVAWWRHRNERFDAGERQALYARLFGSEAGHPVAQGLTALCSALVAIDSAEHTGAKRQACIRASRVASELGVRLTERASGITGFASREIVAQIRRALALLTQPEIARALGNLGPWQAIRSWSASLLGRHVEPLAALSRARAGLVLIEWLADHAAALEAGETLDPGAEIIAAAATLAAEGAA
jgi:hypothetical protein